METGVSLRDAMEGMVDIELPVEETPSDVLRKVKWGIRSAVPGHPSLNSTEYRIERR